MDAKKLEYVETVNGFDIRCHVSERFRYHIFHPTFDGVYLEAYQHIDEAKKFCNEEDPDYWKQEIVNRWS